MTWSDGGADVVDLKFFFSAVSGKGAALVAGVFAWPDSAHADDSGGLLHTREQEKEQQLAVEEPGGERVGAVTIKNKKKNPPPKMWRQLFTTVPPSLRDDAIS